MSPFQEYYKTLNVFSKAWRVKSMDFWYPGILAEAYLTLSWRRFLSHRKQSIDLQSKLIDWFLYDRNIRYKIVRTFSNVNDECFFHLLKSFISNLKCGALRDLVLLVQFKKREKHPWRNVNFSKVAGFSLKLY